MFLQQRAYHLADAAVASDDRMLLRTGRSGGQLGGHGLLLDREPRRESAALASESSGVSPMVIRGDGEREACQALRQSIPRRGRQADAHEGEFAAGPEQ